MSSLILDAVLPLIQREYAQKEPTWKQIALPQTDFDFLQKECATPSEFDAHNVRNKLFQKMLHHKTSLMTTMKCDYGQVCAIMENERQREDIPWSLWGRILRLYTRTRSHSHSPLEKPFKIFFLANTHVRTFPAAGQAIQPIHINGGYTYPCNHETIIIYRAEDATRVLLHELQHACCLDHHKDGVDRVEAETEAWAELLYVGFLSQGNPRQFTKLIQLQSDWIRCQNEKVRKHLKTAMQFPWRYTVGKEEVWRRWKIVTDTPAATAKLVKAHCQSLRLTFPPTSALKKQFGVSSASTML